MGSVEALNSVKKIIEGEHERVIVVVSAMSGATNSLLEIARLAQEGKADEVEPIINGLYERHRDVAKQLLPAPLAASYDSSIKYLIKENVKTAAAWLAANGEASALMRDRMTNHIVATGEMASSGLLRLMLADAAIAFAPEFIKTKRTAEGTDVLDEAATRRLVVDALATQTAHATVTQGFISSDARSDQETTLGRGGSDYTAAIIAAALMAESLEIWTDVDGFMTADPRVDATATVIPRMTYGEAYALAAAGAKVVYPPTIAPVEAAGIPVWIKNTFNPAAPGTVISL